MPVSQIWSLIHFHRPFPETVSYKSAVPSSVPTYSRRVVISDQLLPREFSSTVSPKLIDNLSAETKPDGHPTQLLVILYKGVSTTCEELLRMIRELLRVHGPISQTRGRRCGTRRQKCTHICKPFSTGRKRADNIRSSSSRST